MLHDHVLLEGHRAPAVTHPGLHRVVAHRQHARGQAQGVDHGAVRLRQARSIAQELSAQQAHREVAIPEAKPGGRPGGFERVHHLPAVAPQPVAALVDQVSQPVGHQIGIGRHVHAVHLDVVGRVGHHHQVVTHVQEPAGELRAAGAAGQRDNAPRHGSGAGGLGPAVHEQVERELGVVGGRVTAEVGDSGLGQHLVVQEGIAGA